MTRWWVVCASQVLPPIIIILLWLNLIMSHWNRMGTSYGSFVSYRNMAMAVGVSPLLPLFLLAAGQCWWCWHAISGLALFGVGRPSLPKCGPPPADGTSMNERPADQMNYYYFDVSAKVAERIETIAKPLPWRFELRGPVALYIAPILLCTIILIVCGYGPIHGLEDRHYDGTVFVLILAAVFLILLDAGQLLWTWLELKRLLQALDRHRLRRAFGKLKDFSWRTLWQGSNVLRSRRLMAARRQVVGRRLQAAVCDLARPWRDQDLVATLLATIELSATAHREWVYLDAKTAVGTEGRQLWEDRASLLKMAAVAEEELAKATAAAVEYLLPAYAQEIAWEAPSSDIALAEEFVALSYLTFIQNIVGRMRTLVLSIGGVFLFTLVSTMIYPFDRKHEVVSALGALLFLVGAVVAFVYAGMHRDVTLSRITDTVPNRLGSDFWLRLAGFVTVPLLAVLAGRFRAVNDLLFSGLKRILEGLH